MIFESFQITESFRLWNHFRRACRFLMRRTPTGPFRIARKDWERSAPIEMKSNKGDLTKFENFSILKMFPNFLPSRSNWFRIGHLAGVASLSGLLPALSGELLDYWIEFNEWNSSKHIRWRFVEWNSSNTNWQLQINLSKISKFIHQPDRPESMVLKPPKVRPDDTRVERSKFCGTPIMREHSVEILQLGMFSSWECSLKSALPENDRQAGKRHLLRASKFSLSGESERTFREDRFSIGAINKIWFPA